MTAPTNTAPGSAGQNGAHTRQWPDNIVGGGITYGPATNYSGFYLADAEHGIPTFGSVMDANAPRWLGGQRVEIFNYPGQTEAIAAQLVHRWNCHSQMLEALREALFWLEGALQCKEWNWSVDQGALAAEALDRGRTAIAAATGEAV